MTRSRDVSAVQNNLGVAIPPVAAGKNFIINGGMEVAQRGTSVTYSGSDMYGSLDRWYLSGYGSGQTYVSSQQTSGAPTGFRYYQRIVQSTANSTNFYLSTSLETTDVLKFAGQTVTLSFLYRVPVNFTTTWYVNAIYNTSTDSNVKAGTVYTTISSTQLANTASWTSKSITFTVPSAATSFAIQFQNGNSVVSGAQFEVTGVQLELGSSATPFSRAGGTIQGELAACQRYYWRQTAILNYSSFGFGTGNNGTTGAIAVRPPVTMRINPTTIDFSNIALSDTVNANIAVTAIANSGNSTTDFIWLTCTVASGVTQYRPYYVLANNNSSAYLGLSAEL